MTRAHALVPLCLALAGCANLNTVHRTSALPNDGIAIHLDAPQRVSVANRLGQVCSEPSPDALQAYASSLGLGFGKPGAESASIAAALSGNAGSIGLRTQSITLMRDALFRICELYFNGAISEEAAVQLLQRSQDLTLGVLAIEQLTGAVVAQQVVLTTGGAASSAATVNDTKQELDRANAEEADKKKAHEDAVKALEEQTKKVAAKKTAADAAKTKAESIQKAIDELAPSMAEPKRKLAEAQAAKSKAGVEQAVAEVLLPRYEAEVVAVQKRLTPLTEEKDKAKAAHDKAKADKAPDDQVASLKEKLDKAEAAEKKVIDERVAAAKKVSDTNQKIAASKAASDKAKAEEDVAAKELAPLQENLDALKALPDYVAAEKAAAELTAATAEKDAMTAAAEKAKLAFEDAQAAAKAVQKLGRSAVTNAAANAKGEGEFSTTTRRYGVSKDTVEALSEATIRIVETVMNKGHMTDTCGVLLMTRKDLDTSLLKLCSDVVLQTLETWKKEADIRSDACAKGKNCSGVTPFRVFVPPLK